jgi:hypothetical protein
MEHFLLLIEVIKDPEKYEKAIEELVHQYRKVAAMVELVGPAKEIDRLRSQAHADSATAKQMVDDAKKKSKTIMDNANKLISKKNSDVEDRLAAVTDKEQSLLKKVEEERLRSEALMKTADAKMKKAEQLHAEGDKMLKEGQALKADFEARMQALRDAAAR